MFHKDKDDDIEVIIKSQMIIPVLAIVLNSCVTLQEEKRQRKLELKVWALTWRAWAFNIESLGFNMGGFEALTWEV